MSAMVSGCLKFANGSRPIRRPIQMVIPITPAVVRNRIRVREKRYMASGLAAKERRGEPPQVTLLPSGSPCIPVQVNMQAGAEPITQLHAYRREQPLAAGEGLRIRPLGH